MQWLITWLLQILGLIANNQPSDNNTPTPVQSHEEASIIIQKTCYEIGESIQIDFSGADETSDTDWIGIFPSDQPNDSLDNFATWVWLCGDRTCDGIVLTGSITITDQINRGRWKAALIRGSSTGPYVSYAVTENFQVRNSCNTNGNDGNGGGNNGGDGNDGGNGSDGGNNGGGDSGGGGGTTNVATIDTDKRRYQQGETIKVSFVHVESARDDFIGIFPSSTPSDQLEDGLLWLWLCNRQGNDCDPVVSNGSVQFFNSSSNWRFDAWPLQVGKYKAYLIQNDDSNTFWPVLAESAIFDIESTSTTQSPTNSPTKSPIQSPTKSPTKSPTNSPTKSPTKDNNENDLVQIQVLAAKGDIINIIRDEPTLAPKFLRLVFHDCIGGCDGCVDLENEDNIGLDRPINALQPIVNKYDLSRADIWSLSAFAASEATQNEITFDMAWWGRVDCDNTEVCLGSDGQTVPCSAFRGPHHEFPGIHLTTHELFDFFQKEFNFSQRDTVAIMGAHTIGVLSKENSGIDGPNGWVLSKDILNNEYYAELVGGDSPDDEVSVLVNEAPQWRRAIEVNDDNEFPHRRIWTGFPDGVKIVMLNTDISLVRNLDEDNMNVELGRVTCAFEDDTSENDLPVCPHAQGALQIAAEFKHDNLGWLRAFEDVLQRLLIAGYDAIDCPDEICKLEKK